MRIKTIIIIIITILLTVLLMQNRDRDYLDFLWSRFYMSKLIMLFFVAVVAFVLGFLVGRPKRIKKLSDNYISDDLDKSNPKTLSDDDKDYIN